MFDINSSTQPAWKQVLHDESTVSFEAGTVGDAVIKSGTAVKINASGLVAPIAAVTDVVVGIVYVGNDTLAQQAQRKKVTVYTNFKGIIRVKASGSVTGGTIGDISGYDDTARVPVCAAPATGGNRMVMFLKSTTDGLFLNAGLL